MNCTPWREFVSQSIFPSLSSFNFCGVDVIFSPFLTSVTSWPSLQILITEEYGAFCEMIIIRRSLNIQKKTCPSATLLTTNRI
jgi:hypothetical protein